MVDGLDQLPPPPPGRTGWPWTESSPPPPAGGRWPRISVVTPSYNQAAFLEETIRSVLLQNYPDLEFIIIDGGSTDGSQEIIRKYEPWLAHWVSGKDRGQTDALNKGFRRATGAWVGWQNSDDYYGPGAFHLAALAAADRPEVSLLYGPVTLVDANNQNPYDAPIREFDLAGLDRVLFPVGNQSMFFAHSIFDAGHYLDESFQWCMDHEYFWRLWLAGVKFGFVPGMRGYYRQQAQAKTLAFTDRSTADLAAICEQLLQRKDCPPEARLLAIRELQGIGVRYFHDEKAAEFRDVCRRLVRVAGWGALSPGLAGRMGAATFGKPGIALARRLFGQTRSKHAH